MTQDVSVSDGSFLERYRPEIRLAAQLLPWCGSAFADYVDDVLDRRRARLDSVARTFELETGDSVAALFTRARDNERLSDLIGEILDTTQRATSERKIRAMGRLLAKGHLAVNDAALDELELMYVAVRDLEMAHIAVLDFIVKKATRYEGVADQEIAALFPNGVTVVYAILKTLERHGLAGPQTPPSSNPDQRIDWIPWDFGLLLYEELLRQGATS